MKIVSGGLTFGGGGGGGGGKLWAGGEILSGNPSMEDTAKRYVHLLWSPFSSANYTTDYCSIIYVTGLS